jgi:hypothetical protein
VQVRCHLFNVYGKPVEMIETTGVRQRKVIDEHSLALEEPTESHRNLPRYLHSLGAIQEDWRSCRLYVRALESAISLFQSPGIGDEALLGVAWVMVCSNPTRLPQFRLRQRTRAIARADSASKAATRECPGERAKARGWGRTRREKEPAPGGSRTHCGSR